MNARQHTTGDEPLDVFVPLHEAAQAYVASVSVLRARARAGTLRAYKVAGVHGREWRVSLWSIDAAGFPPRVATPADDEEHLRVLELEAELGVVRRLLDAERRRADRADQQLGHALLESGRLRAALERAQGLGDGPAEPVGVGAGWFDGARNDVPGPRDS